MAKSPARYSILHGDDEFNLSLVVGKMRREMIEVDPAGMNLAEFDGEGVNAAEVISAVSAYPFLADRRLVIVKGFLTHITRKGAGETGKKQVERLKEDLPHLPDYARLVFVEPKALPDSHAIVKLAKADGNAYEKTFSVPKDLTGWLMTRSREEYQTVLEPAAAGALASVVAGDLRRADNELVKLSSYTSGQPINEAVVALLTPFSSETKVWDVIDAMVAGQGGRAMTLLSQLLDDPDEDAFRIWALFIRQFRLMLLAKEHLTGGGRGALHEALGLSDFQAKKLPSQVKGFELESLERLYRRLRDYDEQIKTGRIDIRLTLETLLASLSR
ncbi:MAG: DNA polymerase III subunit delta [Phototrophicaceae bacterium]|jgi:DNA polymerase-3 subunit delta